jgi:hypothetical protein
MSAAPSAHVPQDAPTMSADPSPHGTAGDRAPGMAAGRHAGSAARR